MKSKGLSSTEKTGGGVTESLRSCRERLLSPKHETTPFIDLLAPCSSGHEPPLFLSDYLPFCMCTPLPASPPDCEIQNPAVGGECACSATSSTSRRSREPGAAAARLLLAAAAAAAARCCAWGKMCVLARALARCGWERARASPYGGQAAAPRLLVPYLENAAAHNLSTSTYRRPIMQSAAAYRRFA